MSDGSFTEGRFVDGQIEGFGKRYQAVTASTYEGHFHQGEMNGKGKMTYGDGSVYIGHWYLNHRSGTVARLHHAA